MSRTVHFFCQLIDLWTKLINLGIDKSGNNESRSGHSGLTFQFNHEMKYLWSVLFLSLFNASLFPQAQLGLKNYYKVSPEETLIIEASDSFVEYIWNGTEGSNRFTFVASEYDVGIYPLNLKVKDADNNSDSATTYVRVINQINTKL